MVTFIFDELLCGACNTQILFHRTIYFRHGWLVSSMSLRNGAVARLCIVDTISFIIDRLAICHKLPFKTAEFPKRDGEHHSHWSLFALLLPKPYTPCSSSMFLKCCFILNDAFFVGLKYHNSDFTSRFQKIFPHEAEIFDIIACELFSINYLDRYCFLLPV